MTPRVLLSLVALFLLASLSIIHALITPSCRPQLGRRSTSLQWHKGAKCLVAMSAGDTPASDGLFSRRNLLEKATGAAGSAGAAYFVRGLAFHGAVWGGVPNLQGKTAVITGANTGLGKCAATRLAALGADVVIACRNPDKAEAAILDLKEDIPRFRYRPKGVSAGSVTAATLDLSNLKSVEKFVSNFNSASSGQGKLDILMLNAGVMAIPNREETADGIEKQFGINHIGHFHLANLLMPNLRRSSDGRIVSVSSSAHTIPGSVSQEPINWENPQMEGKYAPWISYGQSKLANVLFTRELDRRLRSKGNQSITASCLHPGACRTELGRYLFDTSQPIPPYVYPLLIGATYFTKSPEAGAQTQIRLAADPALKGEAAAGKYFEECHSSTTSPLGRDDKLAAELWQLSERLTGRTFDA